MLLRSPCHVESRFRKASALHTRRIGSVPEALSNLSDRLPPEVHSPIDTVSGGAECNPSPFDLDRRTLRSAVV